jgi:hypothetical protein
MFAYLDLDKGLAERLRERQTAIQPRTVMVPRVPSLDSNLGEMHAGLFKENEFVQVSGEPVEIVIGLLFAQPDTPAMSQFVKRRRYFDARTGEDWDLFFPGYYQSARQRDRADIRVETTPTRWWFDAVEFDRKRRSLEHWSAGRWTYSGEADLLLVEASVPATGDPEMKWESLVGAPIETLGKPLDAIMRSVEAGKTVRFPGAEDPPQLAREEAADRLSELLREILDLDGD